MECPRKNLAQVLPARALTPDEAREMLDSVLDVLPTFTESFVAWAYQTDKHHG